MNTTSSMAWPLDRIRRQFPGLQRTLNGQTVAIFDGPAGSQVPQSVADAVSNYLLHTNCNRGAAFATAVESDAVVENAHRVLADFVDADDPHCVIFGANMTSLTLHLSYSLATLWQPGDEVIVTQLDHDANVTPWVLAAESAGAIVHRVRLHPEDWSLDLQHYQSLLNPRTRLVALGYASNATGTVNPVREMTAQAQQVGALVYIDAVHYAPHGRISVRDLGCDFLACSPYKFFGPHAGVLWGRGDLLEQLTPRKLRPSPNSLPGRWMTGTQSHEAIAGSAAAVEYLAGLSDLLPPETAGETENLSRSQKLNRVFTQIQDYERTLTRELVSGLGRVPGIQLYGITDPDQLHRRVPTVSWTFADCSTRQVAEWLAERGIHVWNGNHYALPFTETAGLEPGGTVRAGALHYNTPAEVQRLVTALQEFRAG